VPNWSIGLASNDLLKRKELSILLEPYSDRLRGVVDFATHIRPSIELNVVCLEDVSGPAGTDSTLEALVVTSDTVLGGTAVNNARLANGLGPLTVVVVPLIIADKCHHWHVSSTALRLSCFNSCFGSVDSMEFLYRSWVSLLERLHGGYFDIRLHWVRIVEGYSQPWRSNSMHFVRRSIQRVIEEKQISFRNRDAVELAIWFIPCVFSPRNVCLNNITIVNNFFKTLFQVVVF